MTTTQAIKREPAWMSAALLMLGFVLFVLLLSSPLAIRAYLFQPFSIPSTSMMPTLLEGDYLFVSKYAYGYAKNTSPFPPLGGSRFWAEPARGDVVAFLLPKDNSTVYVKRVVGLPGDRIQMKEGVLTINDVAVAREALPDFEGEDACGSSDSKGVKRWRETLPNGVSYETLDCVVDNGYYDNTAVYTVPSGHFFVLGDNRDNSTDSRVRSSVGYIPLQNMIGRAGMIFFSVGSEDDADPRFERIGTFVR
jgi:signal peptidase I